MWMLYDTFPLTLNRFSIGWTQPPEWPACQSASAWCPGCNCWAATLAPRGSSFVQFNHQPLDLGVKSFASRTKPRTKTYIRFLGPKVFKMAFDYFSRKMLMDITFSLSYSDTEQNKELETKRHWREHKTGAWATLLTQQVGPKSWSNSSPGESEDMGLNTFTQNNQLVIVHPTVGTLCGRL